MDVDGPALTTLEATQAKPKKNKRKSEEMDVDEDEEAPSSKKVKLTKDEKKALKKAMKEKAKKEAALVRFCFSPCVRSILQEAY
jgi:nucleolar protein 56